VLKPETRKDYTGMKGGMLTLLRSTGIQTKVSRQYLWEAMCDCGETVVVRPTSVLNGGIQSCGCLRYTEEYSNKMSALFTIYDPMISTARNVYGRYRDGDITFEDFLLLSQQPCDYCGRQPFCTYNKWGYRLLSTDVKKPTTHQIQEGDFTYNGLDRVDSAGAHTLDNVVPCCATCNWMKGDMSREEFLAHNKRIYLHNEGRATTTTDICPPKDDMSAGG
jgi:hypothetical protein